MAQEFWINSSRRPFPCCTKQHSNTSMSRAAPGRVTVASQTPHLPLMKPLQSFMNQANPDSDSPASFVCGAIYLSQPPPTVTPTCCNLIPPLLSNRACGWESRPILMGMLLDSFQSYGATRSRSPLRQATVPGKRDSSSVAAVSILFFRLAKRSTRIRLLNQNPFHASTNTTSLSKVTFCKDECRRNIRLDSFNVF